MQTAGIDSGMTKTTTMLLDAVVNGQKLLLISIILPAVDYFV
jgi:hypothetical protein